MARKLFISVLGTGLYEKSVYTQGDFKSSETRFIQQATLELIGSKETWTEEDSDLARKDIGAVDLHPAHRQSERIKLGGIITQTSAYEGRNSLRGTEHFTPENGFTFTYYTCINLRWEE